LSHPFRLSPSTRLGPYEILSPIGAGGMGEVYSARDTRLERTVAIKLLPAHLAGNERLRARFEREGKAVSSLNHPHICTLHDVGVEKVGGEEFHYLVLEGIEGESLADRLARGGAPSG
jgi:eukaryotic-like serine/threonine-protein kinase